MRQPISWQISINSGSTWTNLSTSSVYGTSLSGNTSTLSISPCSGLGGNEYRCALYTSTCSTPTLSSVATLSVNPATAINTQPQVTNTQCAGNSTAFSVGATGTGLTYQWQVYNGVSTWTTPATATTSVYTIGNVNGYNGYQYQCIVGGTCSPFSVTSNPEL